MTFDGTSIQNAIYISGESEWPVAPEEWEALAEEKLDPGAFGYIAGGAGGEATIRANREAFERRRIRPRMLTGNTQRDLSVEVLGTQSPAPFLLAPVGVLSIAHEEGELAVARAAAALEVPFCLSTAASSSIEDIAEAMGDAPRWFQLYWINDREIVASLLQRAGVNGFSAVVVTLDTPILGWRPRDLRKSYLPFIKGEGCAQFFSDPVFRERLAKPPEEDMLAAAATMLSTFPHLSLTWDDLTWLRELTDLPLLVKGVLTADDARMALERGVDGIIVSNHGGRQVDGAVAALDALVEVRDGVGADATVLMDGGIRHGTDVVKAMALGADAVLVGRPYAYGLAVGGQEGVETVLRQPLGRDGHHDGARRPVLSARARRLGPRADLGSPGRAPGRNPERGACGCAARPSARRRERVPPPERHARACPADDARGASPAARRRSRSESRAASMRGSTPRERSSTRSSVPKRSRSRATCAQRTLCVPSQLSKTIASRHSRGSTEKSSIVPFPPSTSMPRRIARVAAADVENLFALTRMRWYATSSSSGESTSRVTSSEDASAASASARITARLSRTSGNSTIAWPNATRSRAKAAASRYARRITAAEPTAFSQLRGVQHVAGRDLEAVLERADRIRDGAVEDDLARGERACAELVLELADREAVRPAVDRARHEEAADTTRSFRRALGPGGDGELVGVRDRAEPLLAVQPPGVAVPHGARAVRADVRAAVLLREELRPALTGVVVSVEQWR